jgi:alkylation response protein AidB-like acyl-CoA dehydrogenase
MGNSVPLCLAAASLPERERLQVFADPDLNFGFSGAPLGRAVPMDGGYRVSGQWPVVTGSEDAKWCALAGLVMDGETPRQMGNYPDGRLFLIPTAAIEIAPTWQAAAAMRGTGSNAVSVHDVFVPEVFAYTPAKPLLIDRPLFRLPLSVAFGSLPAAIICGIFASALESATEALGTKVSAYSGKTLRDQPPIQELIAECSGALRAARAGLFEASSAIWALVSTGKEVPNRLRAELHASSFHAAEMGREMISRLYARGTRAAFMQGNPVERALRNIHAIVFGFESGRNLQHAAGRVLLGGEPLDPSF